MFIKIHKCLEFELPGSWPQLFPPLVPINCVLHLFSMWQISVAIIAGGGEVDSLQRAPWDCAVSAFLYSISMPNFIYVDCLPPLFLWVRFAFEASWILSIMPLTNRCSRCPENIPDNRFRRWAIMNPRKGREEISVFKCIRWVPSMKIFPPQLHLYNQGGTILIPFSCYFRFNKGLWCEDKILSRVAIMVQYTEWSM